MKKLKEIPPSQLREEYKLDQLERIRMAEERGEITFSEAQRRREDLAEEIGDLTF